MRTLREREDFEREFDRIGARVHVHAQNPTADIHVGLADYPAGDEGYAQTDGLILHLCLRGGGAVRRHNHRQRLDGALRPGRIGIAVPGTGGDGFWPGARLLAIGVTGRRLERLGEQGLGPDRLEALGSRLHQDELLASTMLALRHEASTYAMLTSFVDHAVDLLARRMATLDLPPRETRTAKALDEVRLKTAVQMIDAWLGDDLTVEHLAAAAGMSRFKFSRAFKAATGLPPYAFIARRRIDRAKEYMAAGRSVTAAAIAVGFHNTSQFSASFRVHEGVLPSVWRSDRLT